MSDDSRTKTKTWRTIHGDLTDEEWELIDEEWELIEPLLGPKPHAREIGRPLTVPRRRVIDAILFVAATGCQWRALPECYPNWNTVHRLHLRWSRDGTWERISTALAAQVREAEGRDADATGSIVDARSVRAAPTIANETKGYDAGKKIKGRKTFGITDTLGLLIALVVVAADVSDNTGGIAVVDRARQRNNRIAKLWCDGGFKKTFIEHCRNHHISAEVVTKIAPTGFEVLPRRWVIERTWAWIMAHRRLQLDYERDPVVHEGFIWVAHSRLLLRRLTEPANP